MTLSKQSDIKHHQETERKLRKSKKNNEQHASKDQKNKKNEYIHTNLKELSNPGGQHAPER